MIAGGSPDHLKRVVEHCPNRVIEMILSTVIP